MTDIRLAALAGLLAFCAAAHASAATPAPTASPTLRQTVVQAGSGSTPVFTATLEQLDLPGVLERSACDLLRDANLRARIESRLAEPEVRDAILGNDAVASLVDIVQVLVTGDGTTLQQKGSAKIRLRMAGGTYIDALLDPTSTLATLQLRSARTAAGQLIPRTLDDVAGHWAALEGDDLDSLARHMRHLGASVRQVSQGEPGLDCLQGACTLRHATAPPSPPGP